MSSDPGAYSALVQRGQPVTKSGQPFTGTTLVQKVIDPSDVI